MSDSNDLFKRYAEASDKFDYFNYVLILWICCSYCGCSRSEATTAPNPVVSIQGAKTTELRALEPRIYALADSVYPKLLKMTEHRKQPSPRRFSVRFSNRLESHAFGLAKGDEIQLNADWLALYPADLDVVFVHEMAHIAQGYPRTSPLHWIEGMADYARFTLGFTNAVWSCECSAQYYHYTSGRACTGAFLLYLDRTQGRKLVNAFDVALLGKGYGDSFFESATGKNLDTLWDEFKANDETFFPIADTVAEVANALGNPVHNDEKLSRKKLLAYLSSMQENNPASVMADIGYSDRMTVPQFAGRYSAYRYFQTPGGRLWNDATSFLVNEGKKGLLPGWTSSIWFPELPQGEPEHYPFYRTVCGRIAGTESYTMYELVRLSKNQPWILKRAWLAGPKGEMIKELMPNGVGSFEPANAIKQGSP
jgi:hypothetical protein